MAYGVIPRGQVQYAAVTDPTVDPSQGPLQNPPLNNGAYNPMFNMAQGHAPTLKDLGSLYYKMKGQGTIGDNPHPWATANLLADSRIEGSAPVESASDVQAKLRNSLKLYGGNRKALADDLINQVQQRQTNEAAKGTDPQLIPKGPIAAPDGHKGNGITQEGMKQWFSDYVNPYMEQESAVMKMQADMFDETVNNVLGSGTMDPMKAQILQSYAPLLSQAYHQKADNFSTNFLRGNDNASLIGKLLTQKKRNAAAINFLYGNTKDLSGGGSGGGSFTAGLLGLGG